MLWEQAKGDPVEYQRLMVEAGHIIPVDPCPTCGKAFRHRHEGDRVIRQDIFGHDERARSLVCSIGEHAKCDGHAPNGQPDPCDCRCHS